MCSKLHHMSEKMFALDWKWLLWTIFTDTAIHYRFLKKLYECRISKSLTVHWKSTADKKICSGLIVAGMVQYVYSCGSHKECTVIILCSACGYLAVRQSYFMRSKPIKRGTKFGTKEKEFCYITEVACSQILSKTRTSTQSLNVTKKTLFWDEQ